MLNLFKKKPSVDGKLVSNLTYIARTEPWSDLTPDMVVQDGGVVYYLYKNELSNRKVYKRLKEENESLKRTRDELIYRLNEYQQEV